MTRSTILWTAALLVCAAPAVAQSHGDGSRSDPPHPEAGPADSGPAAEVAAVRAALEHYLLGHATGDGSHHARVFHPVASLYWVRDDSLNARASEAYVAGSPGRPADDEADRRRWIDRVDVTGTTAVARIVLDYPAARITDYMSLLKIDGEWKIVNKIFDVQPKEAP